MKDPILIYMISILAQIKKKEINRGLANEKGIFAILKKTYFLESQLDNFFDSKKPM